MKIIIDKYICNGFYIHYTSKNIEIYLLYNTYNSTCELIYVYINKIRIIYDDRNITTNYKFIQFFCGYGSRTRKITTNILHNTNILRYDYYFNYLFYLFYDQKNYEKKYCILRNNEDNIRCTIKKIILGLYYIMNNYILS